MRACAAGVDCLVCQFVCLFIFHHFLACCSGILDLFKVSFSSVKMVLVNKLAFLCSAFESDHPEGLFSSHLDVSLNFAFSPNDQFEFNAHFLA